MKINTFMDSLDTSKNNVMRMILFDMLKTGNPIIDTFLMTIILGVFSWLATWFYESRIVHTLSTFAIEPYLYKKNTIILEGMRTSSTSIYSPNCYVSGNYSDRFKAIWNHIINTIDTNQTIYQIKETYTNYQDNTCGENTRNEMISSFMTNQLRDFVLDKDVYVNSQIILDACLEGKEKHIAKSEKIIITVYSYKRSLFELKQYIDNITEKYLTSVKNNRINKRFIYSLENVEIPEESNFQMWREDVFESSRTFQNIFFDGKKTLIEKIDFFLNNKTWYDEKGIPYSLGIGLHGPPGTGKTSFIKALANYTNRHIVIIPLKLINTKSQLEKVFFENSYSDCNEKGSITWSKKIIVFEDIDCIGDIVLNREYTKKQSRMKTRSLSKTADKVNVSDILESIVGIKNPHKPSEVGQKITLDDILNLWDGIRETPGRIIVITSNHYNLLDPALIRPGRIDLSHELKNASHQTVSDIYQHLFGHPIDPNILSKIIPHFYSPAELYNIYVANRDEDSFTNRLLQHVNV